MFKFLLLIVVVIIAANLIKRLYLDNNGSSKAGGNTAGSNANKNTSKNADNTLMLKCTHCQVHIPEDQGINSDKLFFCSEEHKREYHNKDSNN